MMLNELNSKQIVRNINLCLLSDMEIEEPFLSIYNDLNYLKNLFTDLNIYVSTDAFLSQYKYYGKSKDELYIRHDIRNKEIDLDYDKIWSILEKKHNIPSKTVKELTQSLILEKLNIKATTQKSHTLILPYFTKNTLRFKGKL